MTAQGGTGFFGKVPGAGDFVARGLAPGVRQALDRFLTARLGQAARQPERWPEGGLRAVIDGPGGPLLLCIVPSLDAAGRAFPVAACVALGQADRAGADIWAEAVLDPLWHIDGVADLEAALAAVAPPAPGDDALPNPPVMWLEDTAPEAPELLLPGLFG